MTPAKEKSTDALTRDVIAAFDDLNGLHSGYRPAHAKGILIAGVFTPSPEGAALTRAPHLHRQSTPVSIRFSNFAGVPTIPDNSPDASPRGMAIRFHLAEHKHTDIVAHSVDGFPARTAEEFVEFLRAVRASGPDAPKPSPIERFLASHPAALEFVQTPKPIPVSFATESYFGVSAYQFTGPSGESRFGRYRIRPENPAYLSPEAAAAQSPNFLMDEMKDRLARGPFKLHIDVQLALPGDVVDNATIHWPEDRPQVSFGTIELCTLVPDNDAQQRHIIFDPIPRIDGIEPSADPLLEPRADVYLATGRRRRAGSSE
ncbi:MAG: catalase family peroxidase [Bryobacteraceae bacterium]